MNDERTRDLAGRSFEERVFARFDSMDARFDAMETRFDARFDGLDTRVQALEAKALDTKPIWERALAEIAEVREVAEDIKRKFEILIQDVMQVRTDQRRVERRIDALESRP
jgi:BMFP domain-containing protein YqiC